MELGLDENRAGYFILYHYVREFLVRNRNGVAFVLCLQLLVSSWWWWWLVAVLGGDD